jgi:hypothetical protein
MSTRTGQLSKRSREKTKFGLVKLWSKKIVTLYSDKGICSYAPEEGASKYVKENIIGLFL